MLEETNKNTKLIEKCLEKEITDICRILRIGRADWDIDRRFRNALSLSFDLSSVKKHIERYDSFIKTASEDKITINPKYWELYNLYNNK